MNQLPVDHIIALLNQQLPALQGVYIYGSFASEQITENSDVDIGLLLSAVEAKKVKLDDILDIQVELESLLSRSVDLVNMRTASTVLQFEIVNTGTRVFTADPFEVDLYELLAISLYQKLVIERREIVEEGLKTGFYSL